MHPFLERIKTKLGYVSYGVAIGLTITAILTYFYGFESIFLKKIYFKQELDLPCAILFAMIAIMFFSLGISLTTRKEEKKDFSKIIYLKVRK